MNDRKRRRLKLITALIMEVKEDESQDIKDLPDNIENSEITRVTFGQNVVQMQSAIDALEAIS